MIYIIYNSPTLKRETQEKMEELPNHPINLRDYNTLLQIHNSLSDNIVKDGKLLSVMGKYYKTNNPDVLLEGIFRLYVKTTKRLREVETRNTYLIETLLSKMEDKK